MTADLFFRSRVAGFAAKWSVAFAVEWTVQLAFEQAVATAVAWVAASAVERVASDICCWMGCTFGIDWCCSVCC